LKKVLLILALLAAALSIGVSAFTGAGHAKAPRFEPQPASNFVSCSPSTCGGGNGVDCNNGFDGSTYHNYAGYWKNTSPGIGNSISATVNMVSSTITSTGGDTAVWTGTDNGGGGSGHWIQAGLYRTGTFLHKYVEWQGSTYHLVDLGAASFNTNYAVTITHVANGQWKGEVGGSSWVETDTTDSGLANTQTTTESLDNNPSVSCNGIDAVLTNMNPARNTMTVDNTPPDFVENVGAATFEGVQLQVGS
jgi:hypothetical protein